MVSWFNQTNKINEMLIQMAVVGMQIVFDVISIMIDVL